MTTPEQPLAARLRGRILDDEALHRVELDTPGREEDSAEDAWVKDFVDHLIRVIRNMGGKM